MNPAELNAHDLRSASFHEAGHAIIAKPFSHQLAVKVFANLGCADVALEKTVLGNAQPMFRTQLTPLMRSALGWAGLIGETLGTEDDLAGQDEPCELWDWVSLCGVHELSATDQAAIAAVPEAQQRRAFGVAYRRIQKEWPLVTALANRLIADYPANRFAGVYWTVRRGWSDARGRRFIPVLVAERTAA